MAAVSNILGAATGGVTSAPNRVGTAQHIAPSVGNPLSRLQAMSPQMRQQFNSYIQARSPAPVAGGGTSGMAPTALPATQEAVYGQQRDSANEAFNAGLQHNQTQLGQTQLGYLSQFRDMGTANALARTAEPTPFVQRGILGSGIDHDTLQRMYQTQLRAGGDLRNQESGALGTLYDARNALLSQRDQALAAIEQNRQRALAQLALGSLK